MDIILSRTACRETSGILKYTHLTNQLTNQPITWSRVLPKKLTQYFLILSRYSLPIEPDSSAPCAQEPTTCPYLEPDQSTPRPPILLLQEVCEYYFPPMPRSFQWFPSSWFPYPKPYIHFCYSTYVPRTQSISIPLIWSAEMYLVKNTNRALCNFLQSPIVSALFCPNIFLSTPFSNRLSPCYCLYITDHISHSSQITGKIIFPCILIVKCAGIKRKGKRFLHKATWYYQGS